MPHFVAAGASGPPRALRITELLQHVNYVPTYSRPFVSLADLSSKRKFQKPARSTIVSLV
jgi:hypothetical protein